MIKINARKHKLRQVNVSSCEPVSIHILHNSLHYENYSWRQATMSTLVMNTIEQTCDFVRLSEKAYNFNDLISHL